MYMYDVGLVPSLIIGGVAGLIYMFVGFIQIRDVDKFLLNPMIDNPIALGLTVFGTSFCLVFAVLNPLVQVDVINFSEVERQLSNGTLVLRLSTIAFTGPILWRAVQFLRDNRDLIGPLRGGDIVIFGGSGVSDRDRKIRDLAQSGIFIAVLFTLWILSAHEVRTTLTAIMAYVFAFFSDDWVIIADYSKELKGRILWSHRMRIRVANILLLVPLAVVATQEFGLWGLIVFYLAMGVLLAQRYVIEPWVSRDGVDEQRVIVKRHSSGADGADNSADEET